MAGVTYILINNVTSTSVLELVKYTCPSPDHLQNSDWYEPQNGMGLCDLLNEVFLTLVDVLEENALNEKFCGEVLKILITKADTEINELEKDLVTIQSELAWTEYEEWSEICCSTLREKIDHLDTSLKSLRNGGENESDVGVLGDGKPAEEVHEIVKALLHNFSAKKDEQCPDTIAKDSSSGTPAQPADLNVIVKEELVELINEKSSFSSSTLKLEEEKTNFLETKPTNTSIKDAAIESSSQLASGYYDEKKISHNNNSKLTTNNKTKMQGSTQNDNEMIRSSFFRPSQKDSGIDAPAHATGNSCEMKKLCISDFEVDGDKKGTAQCSATKKSENLSSSLCCSEGKGCIPKAELKQPEEAVVKCYGALASRYAADNGGKEQGSESRSGAFELTEGKGDNVNQKLIDIVPLIASLKDGAKVCPTKIDSVSFLKTKKNRKDAQKVVETGITNNEHLGLISISELQDQRKKDTLKPQSEEGTLVPPLLALHKAGIAVDGKNSNSNTSLKPENHKAKRKFHSNLPIMLESSGFPNRIGLELPISKVKKRQRSAVSYDNVCLNQLFDRKILKKPVHPTAMLAEKKTEKSLTMMPLLVEFDNFARDMSISESFGEGTKTTSNSVDGCDSKAAICLELSDMKLAELKAIAKQYKLPQYSKLRKDLLIQQLTDLLKL